MYVFEYVYVYVYVCVCESGCVRVGGCNCYVYSPFWGIICVSVCVFVCVRVCKYVCIYECHYYIYPPFFGTNILTREYVCVRVCVCL